VPEYIPEFMPKIATCL
jgi:hypothetical protein